MQSFRNEIASSWLNNYHSVIEQRSSELNVEFVHFEKLHSSLHSLIATNDAINLKEEEMKQIFHKSMRTVGN